MSEESLLYWIADFLGENPRVEQQLVDHMNECDDFDQEEIENALDDFKNNH